jgi:hypothetical protein
VHQLGEYVIGLALISAGMQNPSPTFPVLAGGVILVSAALVSGPLGAWRAVSRPAHRWVDVAVMAVVALTAVMPFLDIDNTSRLMMVGAALVMLVLWWSSNFAPPRAKVARTGPVDRSEAIGRTAGRLVAQGRALARSRRPPR